MVRAFQKELKLVFSDALVFAADSSPDLAAACHIADGFFQLPKVVEESYISYLIDKCKELDIGIIIPTIDTELDILAQNMDAFRAADITPVVSDPSFIAKCRNKRLIHEFFSQHGILVAQEYDKHKYRLPVFIKPLDGSRSVSTYIIKDKKEFQEYHFSNEKLMFLEYLDHDQYEEFTCDLYYDRRHRLRCVVPRKRIEVRSGEVSKGLTVNNELVPAIRQKLGLIPGARGCLTSQFFRHKKTGEVYGIEINARFGGGFPLTYLAGANFPAWIIHEYLKDGQMTDQFDAWEENLLMLRYAGEVLVHGYKG